MGDIIVPRTAAIEDRKALRDVEIQEAEGWKGPLLIVQAIDDSRAGNDESSGIELNNYFWR